LDHSSISHSLKDSIISNSWLISEWLTLIGFTIIGLDFDFKAFFQGGCSYHTREKNERQNNLKSDSKYLKILYTYAIIQLLDFITTYLWSYFIFYFFINNDDDSDISYSER
jgi:hypothetical protein